MWSFPNLPSAIGSQVIWYNKRIKVDGKTIYRYKGTIKIQNNLFKIIIYASKKSHLTY